MGNCFSAKVGDFDESCIDCKFHVTVYEQEEQDTVFNLKNEESDKLKMKIIIPYF